MKHLTLTAYLVILLGGSTASAQHDEPERPTENQVTTPEALPGAKLSSAGSSGADEERIKRISARFRGSIFLFDQSLTPDTLNPQAQLSPVPSYQWWLSLRPRYYFRPDLSLRVRMDLTVEWLNGGAETTLKRQGIFGDIWTDLAYTPKPFLGVNTTVALRVLFPTSLESIAASTVMKVGPSATFVRPFNTRIGDFEPLIGVYALYNFVQNTSAGVNFPYHCTTTAFTPNVCDQGGGAMDNQISLVNIFGLRYNPITKVGINLSYLLINAWAYDTPTVVTMDQTGGTAVVPKSASDTRFRQSSWFLASVDYDPLDWLSLSLGYYTIRPTRDPDGSIGDPLYKPGGASRIFLTTTFNLDKVYEAVARRAHKPRPVASRPSPTM